MKESIHLPAKWIGNAWYIALLMLVGINAWNKPLYNADILPYMGVIIGYETRNDTSVNAKTIHDKVYAIAQTQLPPATYKQLTDTANPYRYKLAVNAGEFSQQMPFYVVKPLYTLAALAGYKAGLTLTRSTVVPSIIAYFFIGMLLIIWLSKTLPYWPAFLISLLIMLSPPLLEAVRLSSPDCLSAFLILCGIYFITEKMPVWGYCFLLTAIFARLDNILPLIIIVITLGYYKKLSILTCLLGILLAIVCYFGIAYSAYSYGWGPLYFTTFFTHMNVSYDIHAAFSINSYVALVKSQIMTGLYYSHLIFFAILATLLFIKKPGIKRPKLDMEQILCLVIILIITFRFVLQPVIADRFYIAYYLAVIVFLAKRYMNLVKH